MYVSGLSVRSVHLRVLSASVLPHGPIHRAGRCPRAAFEVVGSRATLRTVPAPVSARPGLFLRRMWSLLRACVWSCQAANPPGGAEPHPCLSGSLLCRATVFCVKWNLCASPVWRHRASWTHRLGPRGSEPDTTAPSASPLPLPPQDSALILPHLPRLPGREGSPSHTHTPSSVLLPIGHAPGHQTWPDMARLYQHSFCPVVKIQFPVISLLFGRPSASSAHFDVGARLDVD